jgi:hypothetical protein
VGGKGKIIEKDFWEVKKNNYFSPTSHEENLIATCVI